MSGFISINQNSYIDELEEVNVSKEKRMDKHAEVSKEEAWQWCGLARQLNLVSGQIRPDNIVSDRISSTTSFKDIADSACEVSLCIKNAIVNGLILAKKDICKVRTDTLSIRIVDLQDIKQCSFICFFYA